MSFAIQKNCLSWLFQEHPYKYHQLRSTEPLPFLQRFSMYLIERINSGDKPSTQFAYVNAHILFVYQVDKKLRSHSCLLLSWESHCAIYVEKACLTLLANDLIPRNYCKIINDLYPLHNWMVLKGCPDSTGLLTCTRQNWESIDLLSFLQTVQRI